MSVVALTTLWLAATTPAAPAEEKKTDPPTVVSAGEQPVRRGKPATDPPSAPATKKNSGNDEPGCEE